MYFPININMFGNEILNPIGMDSTKVIETILNEKHLVHIDMTESHNCCITSVPAHSKGALV